MQLIPFETGPGVYNVFVILEDENIARLKKHDPAQFNATKLPPEWQEKRLHTVIIGYASHDDVAQVRALLARGAAAAALEYLSRGFAYQPEKGDSDAPYGRGH